MNGTRPDGSGSGVSGQGADTFDIRFSDARDTRLSSSLSGTNLVRAGDYNMRTVLQAIRISPGTTRVAVAERTGLTAATIANITTRLTEAGLIRVVGRRLGGRGQPPLKLEVDPDGAYAVGVNIDRDHLSIVILDLAGRVRSRATREVLFALPDAVRAFLREELNGLIARGKVDRKKILGIGVAIPDELGTIALPGQPAEYSAWSDVAVEELFADLPWPVHCDNDAAAAALGEAEFGSGFANPSFFYLLISAGLGGGLVIDRKFHRGATRRSGEIGLIPDTTVDRPGATVQDTVSLSELRRRLTSIGYHDMVTHVDAADDRVVEVIAEWLSDAVRTLAAPLTSLNCLLNPDAVLIGGRLPLSLIERLAAALNEALSQTALPAHAPILPAIMARDASAIGAAILPFMDHLLPSDAILIQAGR